MNIFKLKSPFKPSGSQPEAIEKLSNGRPGISTLVGVTGSGKTFTIANIIAAQNKPVLVLSPNKTLAAQLYEEFCQFFPENKVCYFVSYYDYYQPESYLPAQDIYIPKDTKVNSEIERLRIESTASLINRQDTIIIASVSCIYSLGDPEDYRNLALSLNVGQKISRSELIRKLVFIQYERNETEKAPGSFQVLGNTIEVNLPYQKEKLRIELFGEKIDSLEWVHKQNNNVISELDNTLILPAKHFVTTEEKKEAAIKSIRAELEEYAPTLENPLYAERLRTRINHDLEMIQEVGYCSGIENYSTHFEGRASGKAPNCLFDFFPEDFLLIVDESHIALPQLRGMYAGDKARKKSLIDFGFRLPSAYDNRPLRFEETEKYFKDAIFVSATPGEYELQRSTTIAQQIIRPTGLLDPIVEIHPRKNQIDHLVSQIKEKKENGFRTLVTVLTKKMAEELAKYLEEQKIKVCYMHSDIKTPQRTELLHKLRLGVFDCLVGVNLLREGLDLPEVALVAIMDADVESFLRDRKSLIQTIGRAARNTESKVILYCDKETKSIKDAMAETNYRRTLQQEYNDKHNITPKTVKREVSKSISSLQEGIAKASKLNKKSTRNKLQESDSINSNDSILQQDLDQNIKKKLIELELAMKEAAENLEFEKAIELREEWLALRQTQVNKD
ncbi:MAG: UvrABC system protein B [candidate division TM6 bacterium GW2011_GWF2_32_72]|nr:MAG: UvrABC system protein B [candidate division TM6 bacterium GW2011_GWF2_32_72]